MGKQRQRQRRAERLAREASMRRHPSATLHDPEPAPAWWMMPTIIVTADDEPCPICSMMGIEVDHNGIHAAGLETDKNQTPYSEEPAVGLGGLLFDQTPVTTWSDLPWTE